MTKPAMRSSLPTMVLVSFRVKARCFLSCNPHYVHQHHMHCIVMTQFTVVKYSILWFARSRLGCIR